MYDIINRTGLFRQLMQHYKNIVDRFFYTDKDEQGLVGLKDMGRPLEYMEHRTIGSIEGFLNTYLTYRLGVSVLTSIVKDKVHIFVRSERHSAYIEDPYTEAFVLINQLFERPLDITVRYTEEKYYD